MPCRHVNANFHMWGVGNYGLFLMNPPVNLPVNVVLCVVSGYTASCSIDQVPQQTRDPKAQCPRGIKNISSQPSTTHRCQFNLCTAFAIKTSCTVDPGPWHAGHAGLRSATPRKVPEETAVGGRNGLHPARWTGVTRRTHCNQSPYLFVS